MVVNQLLMVPYLNEEGGMLLYYCAPINMKVCSVFLMRNKYGYYHYNQIFTITHFLKYVCVHFSVPV